MKKNLRFIRALIKHKLERMMVYKISFFAVLFVDGSLFIIQVLAFSLIYGQVDTIGYWGQGEMMIFIGTFSLINALNMVIYFFGIIRIPRMIQSGQMDLYLTKPVNPLLRITFEEMNFGSVPLIFLSIGIILYGVRSGSFTPGRIQIAGYIIFIVLGTILWYDLELLLRTVSFFVISAQGLEYLEEVGLDLCMKIPGIALKGPYKVLFYVVLPYAVIGTVPTEILSGAATLKGVLYAIVIITMFTAGTLKFWETGIRSYNSASS